MRPVPPKSSLYRHVDRLLEGSLGARLLEWDAADCSLDDIVRELGRLDVGVSKQTVGNWLVGLRGKKAKAR